MSLQPGRMVTLSFSQGYIVLASTESGQVFLSVPWDSTCFLEPRTTPQGRFALHLRAPAHGLQLAFEGSPDTGQAMVQALCASPSTVVPL